MYCTYRSFLVAALLAICIATPLSSYAESKPVTTRFQPSSGTFTEGSSFDISILVNTNNTSINTIDVTVKFDPKKLSVIRPTGNKSIIGAWVAPPTYDNARGEIHLSGLIPNGITASAGLIGTITFKAIGSGDAIVSIDKNIQILKNDGLGTTSSVESERGVYSIVPKTPQGIEVYSPSHPLQSTWYNNNNPSFSWNTYPDTIGYSYILDDKPYTNPNTEVVATGTSAVFRQIADGEHYFHISMLRNGLWSQASHFRVRIDTTPPIEFKPKVNYLLAAVSSRSLVTFATRDSLSGIDHYEVGVIDKADDATKSPVFTEAASPYQVPFSSVKNALVFVRAFDSAGNVRESSVEVSEPLLFQKLFADYSTVILLVLLIVSILVFTFHFLVGHHIVRHLRNIWTYIKKAEEDEHHDEMMS